MAPIFHSWAAHGDNHVFCHPIIAQSTNAAKWVQFQDPLDRGNNRRLRAHGYRQIFQPAGRDRAIEAHDRREKHRVRRPVMHAGNR